MKILHENSKIVRSLTLLIKNVDEITKFETPVTLKSKIVMCFQCISKFLQNCVDFQIYS